MFSIVLSQEEVTTFTQIEWLKGGNKTQFEGFWSHLKKRVEENCGIERGSHFSK
jgi:23S rRNA (adenine1618-N6)-methyltransferase